MLGRRADGYHDLESLVAFADVGDGLRLQPGVPLALEIDGPFAAACGAPADNLVLKAAAALAARVEGLKLGRFVLTKELPVASGIGGGSADAAAALRLLARSNELAHDDARLAQAALAVGADVPVCLDGLPRIMRGVGDELAAPLDLPEFPALLVNPGVPLATRDVFAKYIAKFAGRHGAGAALTDVPRARARPARMARRAGQRSHASRHCLRAGHCRRARRLGGIAGRAACPHVGVGADLLCALCHRRRGRSGGAAS